MTAPDNTHERFCSFCGILAASVRLLVVSHTNQASICDTCAEETIALMQDLKVTGHTASNNRDPYIGVIPTDAPLQIPCPVCNNHVLLKNVVFPKSLIVFGQSDESCLARLVEDGRYICYACLQHDVPRATGIMCNYCGRDYQPDMFPYLQDGNPKKTPEASLICRMCQVAGRLALKWSTRHLHLQHQILLAMHELKKSHPVVFHAIVTMAHDESLRVDQLPPLYAQVCAEFEPFKEGKLFDADVIAFIQKTCASDGVTFTVWPIQEVLFTPPPKTS